MYHRTICGNDWSLEEWGSTAEWRFTRETATLQTNSRARVCAEADCAIHIWLAQS
jgi:hypothetical protein